LHTGHFSCNNCCAQFLQQHKCLHGMKTIWDFSIKHMIHIPSSYELLVSIVSSLVKDKNGVSCLSSSILLCTEFVLSDIVCKLLSEVWQSLLDMLCQQIGGRNRAKSCVIWQQIESRLRTEPDSSRPCSISATNLLA